MSVYYITIKFQIEKNNNYSETTEVKLRGSPESQSKAKELIKDLLSEERGGGNFRPGGNTFGGNRRGNRRDFSTVPIRKIEDMEPPDIDWDEVNRIYVSTITANILYLT